MQSDLPITKSKDIFYSFLAQCLDLDIWRSGEIVLRPVPAVDAPVCDLAFM
jgi:hypothetical protein